MSVMTPANLGTFAGLRVVPAKELRTQAAKGACIGIYSEGGVGKTHVACMLAQDPNYGPALLLNTEAGETSVEDMHNVDVVDVGRWSDVLRVAKEIDGSNHGYKTVILDSMTEMQSVSMMSITTALPKWEDWNRNTLDMVKMARMFRDISRFKGINVIFLMWERLDKDEDGAIRKIGLGFTPSLATSMTHILNTIGFIQVVRDPPKYTRFLTFAPDKKYDSKIRRSTSSPAMSIPWEIYYGVKDNPLADILNTLNLGAPFPVQKYQKPKRESS